MISVKRPQSDTRAVASQRQDGRLGQRPFCNANKAYDVDAFLRLSSRVVSSTTRPVLHMCMTWTPSMAIYSRCTYSSSATKVAINLLCVWCARPEPLGTIASATPACARINIHVSPLVPIGPSGYSRQL